jgi:hypothetical protein
MRRYTLGPPIFGPSEFDVTMRIHDDARRCVVFFGGPEPSKGTIKYRGTGFLAAYPDPTDGKRYAYLGQRFLGSR